ncbi:MAG: lipoyl(octanoyl) transferase LipB [Legionellales bacterium]|nr:lipoyl(octanoyl) transferase LipB [Legionellales bacterium]
MRVKQLGQQDYQSVWENMKQFTCHRQAETEDELWLLEHFPVYTQGQAGKQEHVINTGHIPIIHSDRGGQITYHGPGQMIAYVLLDLKRRNLGIRTLVCELEQLLIDLLATYHIPAHRQAQAPGVYVAQQKIASIGLRVKNNCTYHGIALNVDLDLEPFHGIHPCGFQQLKMTRIKEYDDQISLTHVEKVFTQLFLAKFERTHVKHSETSLENRSMPYSKTTHCTQDNDLRFEMTESQVRADG